MLPRLRPVPLALVAALALAAAAIPAAGASPTCVEGVRDTVVIEDPYCIYYDDCYGVAGTGSGAYTGAAYCATPSDCYVWTNGGRTRLPACVDLERDDRPLLEEPTAASGCVPLHPTDLQVCIPDEWGCVGYMDGYVGAAYCANGYGCYFWVNGQVWPSQCLGVEPRALA